MSTPAGTHKLTPVDTSGRITIGKAKAGTLYDVAYEVDGRVILTPMVAIPERELWLVAKSLRGKGNSALHNRPHALCSGER